MNMLDMTFLLLAPCDQTPVTNISKISYNNHCTMIIITLISRFVNGMVTKGSKERSLQKQAVHYQLSNHIDRGDLAYLKLFLKKNF